MFWSEIQEDVMEILHNIGGDKFFTKTKETISRKSKRKRKLFFYNHFSYTQMIKYKSLRNKKYHDDFEEIVLDDIKKPKNTRNVTLNKISRDIIPRRKALKGTNVKITKRSLKNNKIFKGLVKYDGMIGTVENVPVYPGTWYSVRMNDGNIIKCRLSSFQTIAECVKAGDSILDLEKLNKKKPAHLKKLRNLRSTRPTTCG